MPNTKNKLTHSAAQNETTGTESVGRFEIEIYEEVPSGVTYQTWQTFQRAWNECPPGKWAKVTLLDNSPRANVMFSLREYIHIHARGQGRILSDRTDKRVFWIHKKG